MYMKQISVTAMIVSLAACGGSTVEQVVQDVVQDVTQGLDNGTIDPTVIPALVDTGDGDLTVEELEAAADEFVEEFGDLLDDDQYTDLSTLQTSGSADFAGVFGLAETQILTDEEGSFIEGIEPDDVELAGEMTLTLDLVSNALTGSVENLTYVDDEEALLGTLAVAATLNRSANLEEEAGIFGTIAGDLTDADGEFSLDLDLVGDLYGENAEILAGDSEGSIIVDGDEVGVVSGVFGLVNRGALD